MGQSAQKPEFTPFGTAFQPIGYLNGKPIWPVLGGAEDDADGSSGAGGSDGSDADADENGNGDEGNGTESDGSESQSEGDGKETVSKAEFDRITARMKAADQRASAAENKIKKIEDAEKTDLERATSENEELKTSLSEKDSRIQDLTMELAFFKSNKVDWHDPALARKEIDMALVTVDDDGTVRGMDKALEKLAKDKPFLVNKGEQSGGGRSGGSFNGGGGKSTTTDKNKLANKYSALRGRGGN